jgi:hypothetical protein
MGLDAKWVERLHTRLAVRYGSRWTGMWEGIDPALVRADWADVLDGLTAESIGYALEHLPSEFPPTAQAFRALCMRAPAKAAAQLPAPAVEPGFVDEVMARLQAARPAILSPRTPAERCLANIRDAVARNGGRWSAPRRDMVMAMHSARLVDASDLPFCAPRGGEA